MALVNLREGIAGLCSKFGKPSIFTSTARRSGLLFRRRKPVRSAEKLGDAQGVSRALL
jgi:hypothetical protein